MCLERVGYAFETCLKRVENMLEVHRKTCWKRVGIEFESIVFRITSSSLLLVLSISLLPHCYHQ